MTLSEKVRAAIERRLNAIEAGLARVDGLAVERRGDTIRVRGRRIAMRSIADVRLRFARYSR